MKRWPLRVSRDKCLKRKKLLNRGRVGQELRLGQAVRVPRLVVGMVRGSHEKWGKGGAKRINLCSWGQLSEMPTGGPGKTTGGKESRRPPGKVRAMERGVCRVPLDGRERVRGRETWSTGGTWARGEPGFLGSCLHRSHRVWALRALPWSRRLAGSALERLN